MAECIECGDDYPDGRLLLGYQTCLSCGALEALEESRAKAKRCAPLYNKGGYCYITDGEDLSTIGRKV